MMSVDSSVRTHKPAIDTAEGPLFDGLSDEIIDSMIESTRDGATNIGQALGLGEDAVNAIEEMAQSQYKAGRYNDAVKIYFFILRMNPRRSSAWRGLGACAHANKLYGMASRCYEGALVFEPMDYVSRVFRGECLCLVGEKEAGLKLLKELITENPSKELEPYLLRAEAIVRAGGGQPSRIVMLHEGRRAAVCDEDALKTMGVEFHPEREITLDAMMSNPVLREQFEDVYAAYEQGRLTLASIGGFTENMLDGMYAVACQFLDTDQPHQAMQTCGYLMMVDPYSARYYQLAGICLQVMKEYEIAQQFYRMASVFDSDDPVTKVYFGECKIMCGDTELGLELVTNGLDGARLLDDAEVNEIIQRANTLLRQFG